MNTAILTACLILLTSSAEPSPRTFGPWNADVAAGDAAVAASYGVCSVETHCNASLQIFNHSSLRTSGHNHTAPTQRVPRPVYNGPQGGAYFLIRLFQVAISPQDGPNCRFHPTCSRYGQEAVARYGAILGGFMAGDRIIRCNPYNPPGDNPIPGEFP